jgi:hypothetical protein
MQKRYKGLIVLLLVVHVIKIPLSLANTMSLELGPTFFIRFASTGDLSEHKNAVGFNFGFNLHHERITTINIQLIYAHFVYEPYQGEAHFFNNRNTNIYNISMGFRAHLSKTVLSPFLDVRYGIHMIDWGDREINLISNGSVDNYDPDRKYNSLLYFAFGVGLDYKISEKIGLIMEGSLLLSKLSSSYILMPINLSVQYKF